MRMGFDWPKLTGNEILQFQGVQFAVSSDLSTKCRYLSDCFLYTFYPGTGIAVNRD
jgi:hypothetical protein